MKKELDGYPTGSLAPSRVDPDQCRAAEGARLPLIDAAPTGDGKPLPNPRDRIHVHEELKAASHLALRGEERRSPDGAPKACSKENPDCFEAQRDLAGTLRAWADTRRPPPPTRRPSGSPPASPARWPCPSAWWSSSMGQLAEAEARAQAALEEDPGRAHQLLAKVALARGDLEEAERQARLSMADAATESEGAMILAQVHVRRSELPQALAVLEEARRRADRAEARSGRRARRPAGRRARAARPVRGSGGRAQGADPVVPGKSPDLRQPRRRGRAPGPVAGRDPRDSRFHG